ncbi:hypothetical protein ElyMa_002503400 [Elysia marginata]|uniref:Uncharacterized protein n=1 Tax=Elysia marginata TaxID=1093978 RepID=A0AAV4GRF0_9GAST|nr:hypothetical protein ElyMa_002503400 [Elysia marginata]
MPAGFLMVSHVHVSDGTTNVEETGDEGGLPTLIVQAATPLPQPQTPDINNNENSNLLNSPRDDVVKEEDEDDAEEMSDDGGEEEQVVEEEEEPEMTLEEKRV